MSKAEQLQYYKKRQASILLKLEDLDVAVQSGIQLADYEPEDDSLRTDQPHDSKFALAFDAEQRKFRGAPESISFRGTDSPMTAAAVEAAMTTMASVSVSHAPEPAPVLASVGEIKLKRRTEAQIKVDRALLNACYFGNTNASLKLVRKGADPEFIDDRDGWAGLHYAARWGDIKIIMALLNAGADVNLRTFGKETALHKATRWDQRDAAILLLHRGALPHFKNGDGNKASAMTTNDELSYLCDNYEKWTAAEIVRIKKEAEQQKFDSIRAEQQRKQEERIAQAELSRRAGLTQDRGGILKPRK